MFWVTELVMKQGDMRVTQKLCQTSLYVPVQVMCVCGGVRVFSTVLINVVLYAICHKNRCHVFM
jgi:hypothetical protein